MSITSRRKKKPKPGRKDFLYRKEGEDMTRPYYYGYFRKIQQWFGFEPFLREWFLSPSWPATYHPKFVLGKPKWVPISRLELLITQGLHWRGEVRKLEEALNIALQEVDIHTFETAPPPGCAVDLKTKKVLYQHIHNMEKWHYGGRNCDLCRTENRVYIDRSILQWMIWHMSDKKRGLKVIKLYPVA